MRRPHLSPPFYDPVRGKQNATVHISCPLPSCRKRASLDTGPRTVCLGLYVHERVAASLRPSRCEAVGQGMFEARQLFVQPHSARAVCDTPGMNGPVVLIAETAATLCAADRATLTHSIWCMRVAVVLAGPRRCVVSTSKPLARVLGSQVPRSACQRRASHIACPRR